MHELRTFTACARGEIVPFNECDFEPAACCIEGDSAASCAAPDDDEIVDLPSWATRGGRMQAGDLLEAGGDGRKSRLERGVCGRDSRMRGFRRKGLVQCVSG